MSKTAREVLEWLATNKELEQSDPQRYEAAKELYRRKKAEEGGGTALTNKPIEKRGTPISEPTGPGAGKIVQGLGTEVAVSTAGKYAGAAAGGVFGPIGILLGYTAGAIGSGIAGSLAAQKIEGRDEISWGRAISAGLINLIPTPGAQSIKVLGKSAGKGLSKMAEQGIKYGALEGAATGVVEAQATSIIDKGELAGAKETALYAGIGAGFGGTLGAVGKGLAKKLKGKTPAEIENTIYTDSKGRLGTFELMTNSGADNNRLKPSPTFDYEFEKSRQANIREESTSAIGVSSTGISESSYDPNKIGLVAKIYQKLPATARRWIAQVTPSIVSRQIADIGIDYRNLIKTGEAIGGRVAQAVARETELDPRTAPAFEKFFDGGEIDPILVEKGLLGVLSEWRDFVDSQQRVLSRLLGDDAIKGLDEESQMLLMGKINASIRDKDYLAQEFEIYTNENFIVDPKLKQKAIDEIERQLDAGDDIAIGVEVFDPVSGEFTYQKTTSLFSDLDEAKIDLGVPLRNRIDYIDKGKPLVKGSPKSMDDQGVRFSNREKAAALVQEIIDNSAATRKAKAAGSGKQPVNAPIRARELDESTNAALMRMMGVVRDPGERARGTVSRLTRLVARASADKRMTEMLEGMNLATRNPDKPGVIALDLRGGKSGLYTSPEVNIAVNQLYASNYIENSVNGFIDGLQTTLDSGVGLSKAVKVLGNLPSYMVQFYGNMATIAQLAMANPMEVPALWNGFRVAMSDIDMFASNQKLSKEILSEIKDAERYGIKGGNIFASDIRSNLENAVGPAQKIIQPFAEVYQVPDTAFRYYGWKLMQLQLKKVYPDLADPKRAEDLKNVAAKLLNDVYQNYDKVNAAARLTTKYGLTPQFATFTMELLRNQYNQGRQIRDLLTGKLGQNLGINLGQVDRAASMRIGAHRAAWTAATLGGATAYFSGYEKANNVTEEKRAKLLESYVEDYATNSPLIMTMDEDNTKFNYLNSSYLVPQRMIAQAFQAGMDGTDETSLMRLVRQEFVGEGAFFYVGVGQALLNKDIESGEKISTNPNDFQKFQEIMEFAIEDMFKPGQARELDKFIKAGKPGSRFTLDQVYARQLGWRVNPRDMVETGERKARKGYQDVRAVKSDWGAMINHRLEELRSLPDQGESQYQEANRQYTDLMQVQRMHLNNFTYFHGADKAIEMLKNAGVSSEELAYLQAGKIPSLPRTPRITAESIFDGLDLDLTLNTEANNEKIMQAIRSVDNPFLKKKMLNYYKKSRMKARKGLTNFEATIDALSSDTQIRILRDLYEGNTAYFKELYGKKVITKEAYYMLTR